MRAAMKITRSRELRRLCLLLLVSIGFSKAGWAQAASQNQPVAANSVQARLGRGYEFLRNDRYEDAVREFRAALALNPKLAMQARLPLGIALFQMDKFDEARLEFQRVRKAVGDNPDVLYYLGRIDFTQGQFAEAARELGEASEHPPFPDTAYYLGSALQRKGDLADAEKWLRKAAELDPGDARVQDHLGIVYRAEGKKIEAERAFALSSQLRSRELERNQLAVACDQALKSGSLQDARPVCEKLNDPRDFSRLTTLGTLYGQHGDYEDALNPFREAAVLEPDSPQAQYNYALACYGMKKFPEAREALEKVIKSWPDLFNLSALFGAVLFQLNDQPAAYQVLIRAHSLNPQDPQTAEFLYHVEIQLAQTAANTKDYLQAVKYLKEASALRPGDPTPHQALADIYSLMGNSAQAAEERREAGRLHAPDPVTN